MTNELSYEDLFDLTEDQAMEAFLDDAYAIADQLIAEWQS